MATYEDLARKALLEKVTLSSEIQAGNQERVFPYQTKLEFDQKCAKPTISIFGSDPKGMARELWSIYDQIVEEGKKRGKPVAPLTGLKED